MNGLSFLTAALERPDRPALVVSGRAITYAEHAASVRACAAWLMERGVEGRGGHERVALVPRADRACLAFVHALVELGVPMVLLHPRLGERERSEHLAAVAHQLFVDGSPPAAELRLDAEVQPREVDADRALAVLFTSGTSGRPKAAVLSRRAFSASARASAQNLGARSDDRWLLAMPPAHVGGLSIITRMLIARGAVVLPAPGAFEVDALIRGLERDAVTILSLVPTMLRRLLDAHAGWCPPASLRALLLGGAPPPAKLLEEAASRGIPVLTTYGLTEACSQVTTQRPSEKPSAEEGAGRPLPGVEVRVVDGGVEIRGEILFDGYLEGEALLSPVDPDGWFATGDIGEIDLDGRLHVHARRGDLILSGGENVYPAEVERALEEIEGIEEACVFGVDDDDWGQRVAAAIVTSTEGLPTNEALRELLGARLAGHKRPRLICRVGELPTNRVGKVSRHEVAVALSERLERL